MSYSLNDPRLSAALDAWATRSPGDDCDEDLSELTAAIDADEDAADLAAGAYFNPGLAQARGVLS